MFTSYETLDRPVDGWWIVVEMHKPGQDAAAGLVIARFRHWVHALRFAQMLREEN